MWHLRIWGRHGSLLVDETFDTYGEAIEWLAWNCRYDLHFFNWLLEKE